MVKTLTPKKKSKKLRYFTYGIIAIIALAIALVLFWDKLPYQSAAAGQIVKFLETQGIKVNSLKIKNLGTDAAEIYDVDLGEDRRLLLKNILVSYQFKKLYEEQKVEAVELQGLQLNMYQVVDKFWLGGIEKLMVTPAETKPEPLKLDFPALLANAPEKLSIKDGELNIELGNNAIKIPFDLNFTKSERSEILLDIKQIDASFGSMNISASNLKILAKYDPEKQKFNGSLTAEKIKIINTDTDSEMPAIPDLKLLVDFSLTADKLTADINAYSKDTVWKLLANLDVPIAEPGLAQAQIKQVKFPYADGEISAKVAKLPINLKKTIVAEVKLKNISLDDLMQKVSDGKITGTGNINGTVPLKYYPDGRIEFGAGELKTDNDGIISVDPSMLPGDNEQMAIARSALENFNYTILKIGVSSKEGKLQLSLSLQGSNPEAFSGKQIKLNVNLSGDVLPLIQQSILPVNDIKQLLKEADSEK